ncbi:hypothetical protein [Cyanobium sp. Morenito 9A2]|uniref:hypothetical protein n=1 Tax=Cyanobium sp. Morenito 9A2 TaxID=2823718 RepID=UPI0020CC3A6D|nr:hypothetical protein [Cyanobium sp. Morenito 9A2]MCP9849676.1 hypothetical protein [Cyanobium sp. Morenito 9A2]
MLVRVATGQLTAADVATLERPLVGRLPITEALWGQVNGIDPKAQQIQFQGQAAATTT